MGDQKVKYLAAGVGHSFAVTDDGSLWAWGDNKFGQLGDGTTTSRVIPTRIGAGVLGPVTSVATSSLVQGPCCLRSTQTLVTIADGSVWGWGNNVYGQLGNGTTTASLVPVQTPFPAGAFITQAALGGNFGLALTSTGSVYVWGNNTSGQFGDGTFTTGDLTTGIKSLVPVLVPGISGVKKVAALSHLSLNTAFALKSDGTLWSWGANGSSGVAGIGSTIPRVLTPTEVTGPSKFRHC